MTAKFLIETLNQTHNRKEFCCRVEALDKYFVEQVTQDIRRRVTVCYVALETTTNKIAGYYTLAASRVLLTDIPKELVKRLPRYPSVPVARLGRLAVDQNYRGQKLGSVLLWDAISRTLHSEIAVFALVVDAKDEQAEAFYRYHGFINFGSLPKQLMLSLTKLVDK
ncbi:MAG: GNAT family N-acetyltransferase [Blastocatellia bacterium]|nr:GNAT family N-acetyltransferase [Blastocatellia bacterium]